VQTGVRRNLGEKIDRLRDHARDRIHLARLQFLQRGRLIDEHLVNIDAKPLEYNGPGQAGACASRSKIDLLAAQILQRLNFIARENVQLRDRQSGNVLDAAVKVRRLALRAEILEHI
jgi:hypothetical protein